MMVVARQGKGHVMACLLLPVDGDGEVGAGDAALYRGGGGGLHPGNAQGVEALEEALGVRVELQQGPGQHVPGRAHIALEVECFHGFSPLQWFFSLTND